MSSSWKPNDPALAWETKKMSDAVNEIESTINPTQDSTENAVLAKESRNPQALGWAAKSAYDYDAYNKTTQQLRNEDEARGGNERSWASNAVRYEWNDEFGEIGPPLPELEKQLFGSEFHVRHGIEFEK
jgi:ATP-dependent RNA helicase DDX3X